MKAYQTLTAKMAQDSDAPTEGAGDAVNYNRPSGYRKGIRDKIWENAVEDDGEVRDPLTAEAVREQAEETAPASALASAAPAGARKVEDPDRPDRDGNFCRYCCRAIRYSRITKRPAPI